MYYIAIAYYCLAALIFFFFIGSPAEIGIQIKAESA
jgi:hypothetical protein